MVVDGTGTLGWKVGAAAGMLVAALSGGCESNPVAVDPAQAKAVDEGFTRLAGAVEDAPGLTPFVEIDHRRRGEKAGKSMPPARVSIFRAPEIELDVVAENPRAAIDLPLRALVYADRNGEVHLAYNSFDFLRKRHGLERADVAAEYDAAFEGIAEAVALPTHATALPTEGDGLIVNDAEGTVPEVVGRLKKAVEETDGAVVFGAIDYQAEAKKAGKDIRPLTLVLFGNPGVGAPAMSDVPELGLDQFCQKVVIWEDDDGVHTAHNDIVWQTDRRGESMSLARRKVQLGLGSTVSGAAQP